MENFLTSSGIAGFSQTLLYGVNYWNHDNYTFIERSTVSHNFKYIRLFKFSWNSYSMTSNLELCKLHDINQIKKIKMTEIESIPWPKIKKMDDRLGSAGLKRQQSTSERQVLCMNLDFWLPPWCWWDLLSSRILCGIVFAYVLGQCIHPIFQGSRIQRKESL